jgi:hypothetical protein
MQPTIERNVHSCAATPGKIGTSVNLITFKRDGSFTLISEYDLNKAYFDLFRKKLSPVFNKAITNLKRQKEHLALQLNFEFGNITNEEFDKQEAQYLVETEDIPAEKLKQDINILATFSDVVMDAEEISDVFNCRIDTAEEAIQMLLLEDELDAGV